MQVSAKIELEQIRQAAHAKCAIISGMKPRISHDQNEDGCELSTDILYGDNLGQSSVAARTERLDDGCVEHYLGDRLIKIEVPAGYQGQAPANADGASLWLRTSVATVLYYDGEGNLHREDGPAVSYAQPIRLGLSSVKGVYWLRGHQLGSRKRQWKKALAGTHKYYRDRLAATR